MNLELYIFFHYQHRCQVEQQVFRCYWNDLFFTITEKVGMDTLSCKVLNASEGSRPFSTSIIIQALHELSCWANPIMQIVQWRNDEEPVSPSSET